MSRDFVRQLNGLQRLDQNNNNWLQRLHIDGVILLLLSLLAVFGLFVLYSASEKDWDMLYKQAGAFLGGLLVMLAAAQMQPRFIARCAPAIYVFGVFLLVIVDVMGHNAMGATRWINIPGVIRFQPAEIMKIAMPATVACYLARTGVPPSLSHVVVSLALIGLPFMLIVRQPDLGTALLVLVSGVFVLFLGGLLWRWIFCVLAAAIPLVCSMWFWVMHDYQKQRVMTFLDPQSDPLGAGWNIIQATAAIGSGGIIGKGWLQGTQSHLDFLPEGHTDFIVAVLGEEFGLLGIATLLCLYVLLISRGIYITLHTHTLFGKLLAGSLTMTLFVYVFVNIGMVSGLLPVVGVPLPFISNGGTSVVTLMAAQGILMSIHTHRRWAK